MSSSRQSRKRLATRQSISDAATRLFFERGFDPVTVDEIAEAADVGRMTVFNHFPRKEDMFFDRDQEVRDVLLGAVRTRDPDTTVIETLRQVAHRAIHEEHAYIRFFDGSRRFTETVAASDALKARARAIRDEMAQALAVILAESVDRPADDADARLVAHLLMAAWAVAFTQAHKVFSASGDSEAAKSAFLGLTDKGVQGIAAAMAGTPYARTGFGENGRKTHE